MPVVSKENGEHFAWGKGCNGWHLVEKPELSVIHECMPPGSSEEMHKHTQSRQFFFVLSGVLTIEQKDATHSITTGHGLEIPPNVEHETSNTGEQDVEFLVISQPHSHGDRA